MLHIAEYSNDENLSVLKHGKDVFHDALALVKEGQTRFHVSRDDGEEYDLQYTKNMDLFSDDVKSVILMMTEGKDLHPEFLDYDEEQRDGICIEFLELFNRAEFECLDEYTIAIARVILKYTDMPVFFLDSRIHWFIAACDRLTVVESFCDQKPKETLRVTPSPVELGMPKNDWSYVSTAIAFQNIFFWQELTAGKTQPIKYVELTVPVMTGIGGILAHITDTSNFVSSRGWSVYLSPGSTRYPDDILCRYFRIRPKPADAVPGNTALISNYGFYSITWYFNRNKAEFDESILDEKLAADMNEYAEAILKGKRTLGILARGTDYTIINMGDDRVHASVAQMLPVIRQWMKEGNYDQIFLATEDKDILDAMRKAFPGKLLAIAQERYTTSELTKTGTHLIADLEKKLHSGKEYEEFLEDTTVNYFYALYILSKCNALMASGRCNGVDVAKAFNHDRYEKVYTFTVGLTGEPGTEKWKEIRPIFAGIFARGSYPERKAFFMTHGFTLDDPVSDEAVRLAWKKTMWIYPYFTRAVVKRNRVYYLAENPLDFVIADTEKILEPGTAEGNYHAVTICYHDRKLNFYIDHVPTDGTAWTMIAETFFYYYYCALDGVDYPVPAGVRTIEDGVPADQETDAYLMEPAIDPQALMKFDTRQMFQYPEAPENDSEITLEGSGHYVIRVPSRELMDYAHTVGGSPSSVLVQLVGQSFQRLEKENDLPYNIFTPVSVRKVMGNPNSLLHQVVHNMYACDAGIFADDERAGEFNEAFRGQLRQFASPQSIHMLCGVYRGIVEGYQKAIGANILDRIMQGGMGPQISIGASCLGRIETGSYGNRIHMDVLRVMPQKLCMAYMMEVGETFYISYTLGAKTDRYVRDMTAHMQELGMSHASWEIV